MKKLRLDFKNRIVNIVTDQKTVIAYMDEGLRKEDFHPFFPDEMVYGRTDNVTFDFENGQLCIKQPVKRSKDSAEQADEYECVRRIPMSSLNDERKNLLNIVGWEET